jgi:hypothetical protein
VTLLTCFNSICPIIYLIVIIILGDATIATCRIVARFVGATNIVIMPAVSGLFFMRLRAIYSPDKYVITFFGCCWLGILGIFIFDTTTILSRFSHDGQSKACFAVLHSDALGYIAIAVYDTLMYLCISWRLASLASPNSWQDRLRSFVTGDGLGWLSKVLLRSGQTYYL